MAGRAQQVRRRALAGWRGEGRRGGELEGGIQEGLLRFPPPYLPGASHSGSKPPLAIQSLALALGLAPSPNLSFAVPTCHFGDYFGVGLGYVGFLAMAVWGFSLALDLLAVCFFGRSCWSIFYLLLVG